MNNPRLLIATFNPSFAVLSVQLGNPKLSDATITVRNEYQYQFEFIDPTICQLFSD